MNFLRNLLSIWLPIKLMIADENEQPIYSTSFLLLDDTDFLLLDGTNLELLGT